MRFRLSSGLALGYDVRGAGRPLVFLHPIGTQRMLWDDVINRLQDEACCVALDFRGHGDSDVPNRPFTLIDLADDVIELLRIRQTENAVVVGCSMGGMVAQAIAGRAPELISGLILAGTSHIQTSQSASVMQKRADEAWQGMRLVAEPTIERWFPPDFRRSRADVVERVRQWLLHDDPVVFSWGWRAIAQLDNTESLRKVKVPVLLVRGSLDASTPAERMRAMQALLSRSSYVEIPDVGHLAPMEQPETFARIVRDFVNENIDGRA